MGFARTYVRIFGVITLLFGAVYLAAPGGILTDAAGFGVLSAGGLTDVRATYGGLQLGIGAFLLWAAADESRVRTALVLLALLFGAVGFGRALGLLLDGGVNPFHVSALPTEVFITGFTLYVLKRTGAQPVNAGRRTGSRPWAGTGTRGGCSDHAPASQDRG